MQLFEKGYSRRLDRLRTESSGGFWISYPPFAPDDFLLPPDIRTLVA